MQSGAVRAWWRSGTQAGAQLGGELVGTGGLHAQFLAAAQSRRLELGDDRDQAGVFIRAESVRGGRWRRAGPASVPG
ncbi:MAG: hypothetical protein M3548_21715 [Actinomycetota bacterium]|nr:hypothetical protein [Actinomycetota bacterium]